MAIIVGQISLTWLPTVRVDFTIPSLMATRTKVLLVGYGNMGRSHYAFIQQSSHAQVVAIVRASISKQPDGPLCYASLDEALIAHAPDLAVISTPHHLHFEQVRNCLQNGCHVLTEKPLAFTAAKAEQLVRLADDNGRLLVVGLQRRHEGFASIFREIESAGKLGQLRLIHGLFAHRFAENHLQGWRADAQQAGAGILHDSAFHLIDLLMYFSGGKPGKVFARVLAPEHGIPHSFTCFLQTDNEVTLTATGSYLSPANSVQEEISIWGTHGALFSRRFCRQWNTDPPQVFFKAADGQSSQDFDLTPYPLGRHLPLANLLRVLSGEATRDTLLTEGCRTLDTHRTIDRIRKHAPRTARSFP